jgi:hypothetical protein
MENIEWERYLGGIVFMIRREKNREITIFTDEELQKYFRV